MGEEGQTLPGQAGAAWLAYQAMAASKQAYFSLLSELDRRDLPAQPTIAETLHLQGLLKAHEENVMRFSEAMAAVTSASERALLLERLTQAGA